MLLLWLFSKEMTIKTDHVVCFFFQFSFLSLCLLMMIIEMTEFSLSLEILESHAETIAFI